MKVKTFELRFCRERPEALEEMFQTWYDKEREHSQYFHIIEANICRTDFGLTYVILYDSIPIQR